MNGLWKAASLYLEEVKFEKKKFWKQKMGIIEFWETGDEKMTAEGKKPFTQKCYNFR